MPPHHHAFWACLSACSSNKVYSCAESSGRKSAANHPALSTHIEYVEEGYNPPGRLRCCTCSCQHGTGHHQEAQHCMMSSMSPPCLVRQCCTLLCPIVLYMYYTVYNHRSCGSVNTLAIVPSRISTAAPSTSIHRQLEVWLPLVLSRQNLIVNSHLSA